MYETASPVLKLFGVRVALAHLHRVVHSRRRRVAQRSVFVTGTRKAETRRSAKRRRCAAWSNGWAWTSTSAGPRAVWHKATDRISSAAGMYRLLARTHLIDIFLCSVRSVVGLHTGELFASTHQHATATEVRVIAWAHAFVGHRRARRPPPGGCREPTTRVV